MRFGSRRAPGSFDCQRSASPLWITVLTHDVLRVEWARPGVVQRAHIRQLSACRSELFYQAWASASLLKIFTTSCPLTCLFRQMQASAMAPSGLLGGWKLSGKEVHGACNPSALSAGKCTQHASVPFGCAHSREALDRLVLSLTDSYNNCML